MRKEIGRVHPGEPEAGRWQAWAYVEPLVGVNVTYHGVSGILAQVGVSQGEGRWVPVLMAANLKPLVFVFQTPVA